MYHIVIATVLWLLLGGITPTSAADTATEPKLNLKLVCEHCDRDYLQEEIPWVNFVRDRQNADVQVISTRRRTGGNGREYTLTFTGLGDFDGLRDTLSFITPPAAAWEETRSQVAHHIKLGLVRYLARTPQGRQLAVGWSDMAAETPRTEDSWDHWVFSARLGSFIRGQESSDHISLWGNVSAKRVTAANKFELSGWGNYNYDRYDYDDDTYTSESSSHGGTVAWAKSLGDHWSTGLWTGVSSSTYSNIALGVRGGPGLEYNIYPYSECARHQLRLTYILNGRSFQYNEETIYFRMRELLVEHTLNARLELVRDWGSVTMDLSGSQYLHDLTKNEVSLFSDFSLQLVRGLSLSLEGQVSVIHNQLSLPRQGADLEEVLLQRRQLSTQYDFWFSFGFRYTFGSIYSSVVNPRFGDW